MTNSPPPVSGKTLPPSASVLQRGGAFAIDIVLWTILLQVMGLLFREMLYPIGPYGKIIGFGAVWVYFAALESRFGMGQTVGKRLLRLGVRDGDGNLIGIGRALGRNLIWIAPFLLISWVLVLPESAHALGNLVLTASLGVLAALFYTLVFNRKAGRALHDLLFGTRVVALQGTPVSAYPRSPRIHGYLAAVLIALGCLASVNSFLPNSTMGTVTDATRPVYDKLWADERFFVVRVAYNEYHYPTGQIFPMVEASAWAKGLPTEGQRVEMVDGLARLILGNYPNADKLTSIEVTVYSQYDLGLAWGTVQERKAMSPNEWLARVGR